MFGQMFNFRVKAAEKALREGRLEEAFRLASADDIRGERRGAAVLATLADHFLERAREHYRSERFPEALLDLDRAEAGGVLHDQIAELRGQVMTVAAEVERREGLRRDQLQAAQRGLEANSLDAGRQALRNFTDEDSTAAALREQIARRSAEATRLATSALELIRLNRMADASERLARARALDAGNATLLEGEKILAEKVARSVGEAIAEGRLSLAEAELRHVAKLHEVPASLREWREVLDLARSAGMEIRRHDFAAARRAALRIARLVPTAVWAREQEELLRSASDAVTMLQSGPLGELMGQQGAIAAPRAGVAIPPPVPAVARLDDTLPLPSRFAAGQERGLTGDVPRHWLVLVDGGGSYLLVRGSQVSIGRAASLEPADIPLVSDVADRCGSIVRVDDDYFLTAPREVDVNRRATRHHLLRDGDRIEFGKRAKLNFAVPSRRSGSAVLDLSDTTKMPQDVRRVVLFSGHATIGHGPSAHIGCRHAGVALLLFERGGTLWVRPKNDGHVAGDAVPVDIGKSVELFGASFVVQLWNPRAGVTPGSAA